MISNGYGFDSYATTSPCDVTIVVWSTGCQAAWRVTVASVADALARADVDAEVLVAHLSNGTGDGKRASHAEPPVSVRHLWLSDHGHDQTEPGRRVLAVAAGDLLACLADDITVSADWVNELLNARRRWPDAAYYTGKVELPPHEQWMAWMASQVEAMVLAPGDSPLSGKTRGACDPAGIWHGMSNIAFDVEALRRCDALSAVPGEATWTDPDHLTAVLRRLADDGGYGVYVPRMAVQRHPAAASRPTWSAHVQQPISAATSWFKHLPDRLAAAAMTIYHATPWRTHAISRTVKPSRTPSRSEQTGNQAEISAA